MVRLLAVREIRLTIKRAQPHLNNLVSLSSSILPTLPPLFPFLRAPSLEANTLSSPRTSSSYSSLDWVLSHWAHFTVRRLIYLCLSVCFVCYCFTLHSCCSIVSTVGRTWWDWSLILRTYLPLVLWHCCLGHLTYKTHPRYDLWCVQWYVKPYSTGIYLSVVEPMSMYESVIGYSWTLHSGFPADWFHTNVPRDECAACELLSARWRHHPANDSPFASTILLHWCTCNSDTVWLHIEAYKTFPTQTLSLFLFLRFVVGRLLGFLA